MVLTVILSIGVIGCSESRAEVNLPTLMCGMCEQNIKNSLNNIDGIKYVNIDLEKNRQFILKVARIEYHLATDLTVWARQTHRCAVRGHSVSKIQVLNQYSSVGFENEFRIQAARFVHPLTVIIKLDN